MFLDPWLPPQQWAVAWYHESNKFFYSQVCFCLGNQNTKLNHLFVFLLRKAMPTGHLSASQEESPHQKPPTLGPWPCAPSPGTTRKYAVFKLDNCGALLWNHTLKNSEREVGLWSIRQGENWRRNQGWDGCVSGWLVRAIVQSCPRFLPRCSEMQYSAGNP